MKNANNQTNEKKGASKKYQYTIYKIKLKDEMQDVTNDNIKDLEMLTFFDSMDDVAKYLEMHKKYICTFKTIKNHYKIINNDIAIFKDTIKDLEGVI